MTTPWSPFPGNYRPTASNINDQTLDLILERLERAEGIVNLVTLRRPWDRGYGDHSDELMQLIRAHLHAKHTFRLPEIPKLKTRSAEQCRICTHWATTFAWRWADRTTDLPEADEDRLKAVSELIERTHPTMARTDLETGQQAREALPWLMSVIRRLQRDVRRERGAYHSVENQWQRASDAEQGLRAEVARLRKKLGDAA